MWHSLDDVESDSCSSGSKRMKYPVISSNAPICTVVMNNLRVPGLDIQQVKSMDIKQFHVLENYGLELHPCPNGCTTEEITAFLTVLASSKDMQDNLKRTTKCSNVDEALKKLSQNEKMKITLEVLTSEECVKALNIIQNNHAMQETVVKILEKPLPEYSGLMVFITSQGGEGGKLFGSDGNAVTIKQLSTLFSTSNCQDLIDKPKIFIIQACSGEQDATRESRGASVGSYDSKPSFGKYSTGNIRSISFYVLCVLVLAKEFITYFAGCIPDETDFMFVYSASEKDALLQKEGSPFLQTFVEVLDSQLKDNHLEGALLNFRREITRRNQCGIPSIITNLTDEIWFQRNLNY